MRAETFVRKVWLPTTLFVLAATVAWWTKLSWKNLGGQLISTVLLAPLIWGATIGKRQPPHLLRGMAVGAFIGVVTQLAPHVQEIWRLRSTRSGQGDAQLGAIGEALLYVMVAFWSVIVGAFVGLAAAGIQRMTLQWNRVPAPDTDLPVD